MLAPQIMVHVEELKRGRERSVISPIQDCDTSTNK